MLKKLTVFCILFLSVMTVSACSDMNWLNDKSETTPGSETVSAENENGDTVGGSEDNQKSSDLFYSDEKAIMNKLELNREKVGKQLIDTAISYMGDDTTENDKILLRVLSDFDILLASLVRENMDLGNYISRRSLEENGFLLSYFASYIIEVDKSYIYNKFYEYASSKTKEFIEIYDSPRGYFRGMEEAIYFLNNVTVFERLEKLDAFYQENKNAAIFRECQTEFKNEALIVLMGCVDNRSLFASYEGYIERNENSPLIPAFKAIIAEFGDDQEKFLHKEILAPILIKNGVYDL